MYYKDRQIYRLMGRWMDWQMDKEIGRKMYSLMGRRWLDWQTDEQTDRLMDKQMDMYVGWTDGCTDRRMVKHPDGQTDR